MKGYNTIKEAFKNGTGDCFFTKNGRYLAVSRKDSHSYYINNGFIMMTYDDVLKADSTQSAIVPQIKEETVIERLTNMVQSRSTSEMFYEEFPDAYGQNL